MINDEKMIDNGKNDASSEKSAESDSDFEEGCDYSDKQLKNMMKGEDSDDFLKMIESIPRKKKRRKLE